MNIIEVMELDVGTKLLCDLSDKPIVIIERDECKFLVFEGDFRRLFVDNEIITANFKII